MNYKRIGRYVRVIPKRWWSIKAWRGAKAVQRLDNWLLDHPLEILKIFCRCDDEKK